MKEINWLYCDNLNEVNEAIKSGEDGITADNIISITYDSNYANYVVIWKEG